MLSRMFLNISLVGAEWVLYFLVLLSILSIALIIERWRFYKISSNGLEDFRAKVRAAALQGRMQEAQTVAEGRFALLKREGRTPDLETEMTVALLAHPKASPEVLGEIAHDSVVRARLQWDSYLAVLATIASNAPFIGLFGTVLGIIKAFHDLSQQVGAAAQTVTAGVSEALVATAFGILVAIPAGVAFNLFQKRVKSAVAEAEALKAFLVGRLAVKE